MTRQRFKLLPHQDRAAQAVVNCFASQPHAAGEAYRFDPGDDTADLFTDGTRNMAVADPEAVLRDIQSVQRAALLPESGALARSPAAPINLDIEMETGTGKTYVYIDTMYRLHAAYGWSKFIVIVPSVAIREGVAKTFEDTREHFLNRYHHQVRWFVYDSQRLERLTSFSRDAGLHCMIINRQAFAADMAASRTGRGAGRIIFDTPDRFGSRRPIDVIAANRPILILDEAHLHEGPAAAAALPAFGAPVALRYTATFRAGQRRDLVHRLDALDAYKLRLVKRIAVRGVTYEGGSGTAGFLYVERIEVRGTAAPRARVRMEVARVGGGPVQKTLWVERGDDLRDLSGGLDQYAGLVVEDVRANDQTLVFTSNGPLHDAVVPVGRVMGGDDRTALRRVQIRETIDAHLERERALFRRGVKVLSLFFVDSVARYRMYGEDGAAGPGEYARMFEEEYAAAVDAVGGLDGHEADWVTYLRRDAAAAVHDGYFALDKAGRKVDPGVQKTGEEKGQSKDVSSYDLILKGKDRLLSFEEPVRFIFSHSALREGWDNPNVFTICTLKEPEAEAEISRRQEVGRGLRIAVDRHGERVDGGDVHDVNRLTVVASESYRDFADGLQKELSEALSGRPRVADAAHFEGREVVAADGTTKQIDAAEAKTINKWLTRHNFVDDADAITAAWGEAKVAEAVPALPDALEPFRDPILRLVDAVLDPALLRGLTGDAGRQVRVATNHANLEREEFQALWRQINGKVVYLHRIDGERLVRESIRRLDAELAVRGSRIEVSRGEQAAEMDATGLEQGAAFATPRIRSVTVTAHGASITVDPVGRVASAAMLTRATVARILTGISPKTFALYAHAPEHFIQAAADLIRRTRVAQAIETVEYHPTGSHHEVGVLLTDVQVDPARVVASSRSIYDGVICDSEVEMEFARRAEAADNVVVYAKLPRSFQIPTPAGGYTPDWAIVLKEAGASTLYLVAETKGSTAKEDLRGTELARIKSAEAFFASCAGNVMYRKVAAWPDLLDAIRSRA